MGKLNGLSPEMMQTIDAFTGSFEKNLQSSVVGTEPTPLTWKKLKKDAFIKAATETFPDAEHYMKSFIPRLRGKEGTPWSSDAIVGNQLCLRMARVVRSVVSMEKMMKMRTSSFPWKDKYYEVLGTFADTIPSDSVMAMAYGVTTEEVESARIKWGKKENYEFEQTPTGYIRRPLPERKSRIVSTVKFSKEEVSVLKKIVAAFSD